MEFILEEIQVKDEPEPETVRECDCGPTSVSNVECGVVLEGLRTLPSAQNFQRSIEVETRINQGVVMSMSAKPIGSIHHVDLDLSDMFLTEKTIKMEPTNFETNSDDPLRLCEWNDNHTESGIDSHSSNDVKVLLPRKERRFKCDSCGEIFVNEQNLNRHNLLQTTCGKSFIEADDLTKHKGTDIGERTHNCEICGKRFRQFSYFLTHKQLHSGEVCYTCETCGKNFSYSYSLARHKRLHKNTGEKTHKCDTCGHYFSDSDRLNRHKKLHTRNREITHKCETCGNIFYNSESLNRHKRIHKMTKGIRKYKTRGKAVLQSNRTPEITTQEGDRISANHADK